MAVVRVVRKALTYAQLSLPARGAGRYPQGKALPFGNDETDRSTLWLKWKDVFSSLITP